MKVLTIDTYFDILEKCTLEAFESLKLKDFYPNNGTKAIWDVSSLKIIKTNGLLNESEKELFKNEYIKENLRVTFLFALERNSEKFNKKYLIQRETFYKKCYESLLYKTTHSELWQKPDFGFNIDLEPNVLNFIWNMRIDIEARSKEQKKETKTETIDLSNKNKPKDLTIQKWFKTGIALATGEAFEVYKNIGNRPTEICRKIGVPETNKTYISATINNLPYNDKNIFNSIAKLKALHKYITENNLKFGTEFIEKYNQIELD